MDKVRSNNKDFGFSAAILCLCGHRCVICIGSIAVFFLLSNFSFADIFDELDSETGEIEPGEKYLHEDKEFRVWLEEDKRLYQLWKEQYFLALGKYKKKIYDLWGDSELPSETRWVSYSEDMKVKQTVDFDKSEIKIELLDSADDISQKEIDKLIENLANTTIIDAIESDPVLKNFVKPNESGIASSQLVLSGYNASSAVGKKNQTLPELLSKNAKVTHLKTTNGKPKTAITAKLPNKKVTSRASLFRNDVKKYSDQYKIDENLIYAIMQTESAFNPLARSSVPAFGLMQIVPGSAGMDVTLKWNGKSKRLKPDQLYKSTLNIHAGTTYLHILVYKYLSEISNPTSRLYCAIAAYNTGAGNVSVAFTGKKNIRRAFPVINKMTPQQVYQTLVKKLPYEETRNYLRRVVKAKKTFEENLI